MLCIFNTTTVFTQAQHKTIQLVSLLADEAQHDTPYEHRYQPHQGAPQPGNAHSRSTCIVQVTTVAQVPLIS